MDLSDELKNEMIELYCNTQMSPTQIAKRLSKKIDINITGEDVCNVFYEYEEQNGVKLKRNKRKELQNKDFEEIYRLRNDEKMSYQKIEDYYKETVTENEKFMASAATIMKKYKAYCDSKEDSVFIKNICAKSEEEKEKKIRKKENALKIRELIYELRKSGLRYSEIKGKLDEMGFKISDSTVNRTCKKVFDEKGEAEPKIIRKKAKENKEKKVYTKKISSIEIVNLKNSGLTYSEIKQYYKHKKISITENCIWKRCARLCSQIGVPAPKNRFSKDKRKIDLSKIEPERLEKILNILKTTKYATDEQIEVFLNTYNIKLNKEQER